MPFDIEALLQPIALDAPTGADLRSESGASSIYHQLKDARAQARLAERSAEAAGDPVTVQPEWRTVYDLSLEALRTRTKDLELAAWLLEASARLEGFAGIAACLTLIAEMVERDWPSLHSIDLDDVAGKVSPLAGLNGVGGEGVLVQPLRMVPLLPGSPYGQNALWQAGRIGKNPLDPLAREFNEAKGAAGLPAIRARAREAAKAREGFARLTSLLDTVCGADAPPSSNIRNTLDEVLVAYRLLLGGDIEETAEATAEPEATPAASPAVATKTSGPREIASREEAFADLLRIADFFRRSEPHSPISYALETLVVRGRMSFLDLLAELLPDAAQRKSLLQHAGIHANSEARSP